MTFYNMARAIPGVSTIANRVAKTLAPNRVVEFRATYNEDNLFTDHWLTTDAAFERAYAKSMAAGLALSPGTKWRVLTACWAARVGQKLGGAFVECGVAKGFMARVIIDYLHLTEPFYLLDTYSGFNERYLSAAQATAVRNATGAGMTSGYATADQVRSTFADQPQVRVIAGAVPDTLPEVTADRIAYLSLDMNAAIPEIAAIEYFWPRLAPGAFVVLDDYGWQGHHEQREAFDDWSRRTGVPLLSSPTGQGLIVKV